MGAWPRARPGPKVLSVFVFSLASALQGGSGTQAHFTDEEVKVTQYQLAVQSEACSLILGVSWGYRLVLLQGWVSLLGPWRAGLTGARWRVLGREDLLCLLLPLTSALSYGAPGVEFTGLHRDTATVTQMHFLPGQVSLSPPRLPEPLCPAQLPPSPVSVSAHPPGPPPDPVGR